MIYRVDLLIMDKSLIHNNYQYDGEEDIDYGMSYEEESAALIHDNIPLNSIIQKQSTDSTDFKFLVIASAFTIVSLGIFLNLIFNLYVLCRKKRRQTSTTLVLFSMSIAYLISLAFYALKMSVYLDGDTIYKFHMYDTIDNWTHGQFLCRLQSGLPVFIKLIVRLSIVIMAFKRLCAVFNCDCNSQEQIQYEDEQDMLDDETVHYSRPSKTQKKSSNQSKLTKLSFMIKIFEWPALFCLILTIWLISFGATLPLFSSYKLSEPGHNDIAFIENSICNSVYKFPEDLDKVRTMYFNYLLFGLILPSFIVIFSLILLLIIQSTCGNQNISSVNRKNNQNSGHHSNSSSSSSTSFTENDSINHHESCSRSKGNNLLIWLILGIHLATSLPQEIYRYIELQKDFTNESVLDNYLSSSLTQPILKAKPYYLFQMLYISEAVFMPCVFLLFVICSLRRTRPTRSESDSQLKNGQKCCDFSLSESSFFRCMRYVFYDVELSQSTNKTGFLSIGTPLDTYDKNVKKRVYLAGEVSSGSEPESAKFPHVSEPINSYNYNDNAMHIIRHPSWQINIKQQQKKDGQKHYHQPENKFNFVKS